MLAYKKYLFNECMHLSKSCHPILPNLIFLASGEKSNHTPVMLQSSQSMKMGKFCPTWISSLVWSSLFIPQFCYDFQDLNTP